MTRDEKWTWMMEWCRKNKMAPADDRVWHLAEEAFTKEFGAPLTVDHVHTASTTNGDVK